MLAVQERGPYGFAEYLKRCAIGRIFNSLARGIY